MNVIEKNEKVIQAERKVEQAKAILAKAKREAKEQLRKEQNHQKYMMGGIIAKYFPECFDYTELELNRIIACAFKNYEIQNMINFVKNERKTIEEKEGTNKEYCGDGMQSEKV